MPLGSLPWGWLLFTMVGSKPAGSGLDGLETCEAFVFEEDLLFGPRKAKAAAPPPMHVPARIQISQAKEVEGRGLEDCLGEDFFIGK